MVVADFLESNESCNSRGALRNFDEVEMTKHNRAKLTPEQVLALRRLVWEEGMSYLSAAEKVGANVCWSNLWNAIRGLSWKTVGGPTGGAEGRKPSSKQRSNG